MISQRSICSTICSRVKTRSSQIENQTQYNQKKRG